MTQFKLDWKVGHTEDPSVAPERWAPATVPGAAQLDWARAEGWPHYWEEADLSRYEWMERVYWVYEARLETPSLKEGQRLFFVCGGVDYRFLVRVGERTLHGQEGMFTPVELDLSELAAEAETLQVVVFPAPDSGRGRGRSEASSSVKPAVSYGWDFHPRLVPCGIWREAYLELRSELHVKDLDFDYVFEDGLSIARLDLSVELSAPGEGLVEWSLVDAAGNVVECQSVALAGQTVVDGTCEIHDPDLWWPTGYGEQPRYLLSVTVHGPSGESLDRRSRRIGFRKVQLLMNEGGWNAQTEMPVTRCPAPMTLEVNGRRIFAKGANWVGPDVFPGVAEVDTYRPLLEKAASCHFNLLRCWGGSAVGKASFFELCDQLGILVWQEFPLACNLYDESPEFLDTLSHEAESIVRALKGHPCVALWCGGNELFNSWSGMTDQSKALRLLNKKCYELDPDTPFLPTSPLMGAGHGGYLFRDGAGRECFEIMQRARRSAYVEFGVPGPASADRLRGLIPEAELFPPRAEGAWRARCGFGAWEGSQDSWLCPSVVEHYFGRPESIEELVSWGQLLQAEGVKAWFEEARRQKPYCSMALSWCFNEPWPTAANNSLIGWPCEPKPALQAAGQACRPTLASARVARFAWREGEMFEAELWMLNDAPRAVKGDRVEAYLRFDDDESFVLGWYFDSLEADENRIGPVLRCRVPPMEGQHFTLILRVEGRPEWNSEYAFCFRQEFA